LKFNAKREKEKRKIIRKLKTRNFTALNAGIE